MRRRGWPIAAASIASIAALVGCAPALPDSVESGSEVSIGWGAELTSTNAGSTLGATAGNLDVAAMTRGAFWTLSETGLVADTSFGTVTTLEQDPFTVEYDLAEAEWSDGVAIDSTDLLLAWAAGSNALAPEDFDVASITGDDGAVTVPEGTVWFDSLTSGMESATQLPAVDEWERSITIEYDAAVVDWRTALSVAVPAHIVGQLAFGIDDPMAAKRAVADAILEHAETDLAAIAAAWNTGFALPAPAEADIFVSSGPYVIDRANEAGVELSVNPRFHSEITPVYQRVSLTRISPGSELEQVQSSSGVDVVQLAPNDDDFETVESLANYTEASTTDGTVWSLTLRVDRGVFDSRGARLSFLHGVLRDDLVGAGAGPWTFEQTNALVIPPGSSAAQAYGASAAFNELYGGDVDAVAERIAAGVDAGTDVCVLYDTDSGFASRAFEALQVGIEETGWDVTDCGASDLDAAIGGDDWDAVIANVPIPTTPEQIAAQWGTGGAESLSGNFDPDRDALIAELATAGTHTEAGDPRADPDGAADAALIAIEASIVEDAVALPLALQPIITVAQPQVAGVAPLPGSGPTLTATVTLWSPEE